MPISGADITKLEHPQQWLDVYLNSWPKRSFATAIINQASFAYPVTDITVDNTSAAWLDTIPGQLVEIYDGSTLVTTGVTRRVGSANTLHLDAKHEGDPGRAQLLVQILDDNLDVIIYDYFPLWTLFSVIRDGVFYKDYDVAFSQISGEYPHPVVNLGQWRQAFVDSGGTATLQFSASNSFDWNSLSLTYLWELPASGATLVTGNLTDAVIEVEFDPGFYLMRCTVTNAQGNGRVGIRPVWINTATGSNAPLSERFVTEITSDRSTLKGRAMNFRFHGEMLESDVMDNGALLLTEKGYYGGTELSSGANYVGSYVGIINSLRRRGDQHLHTILDIESLSPWQFAEELPCPPQVVQETAVFDNWTHVAQNLATSGFVAWYVINYHCPSFMTLFDYFVPIDDRRKTSWETSSNTIGPMVDEVISTIGANIGSESDGTLRVLRDPQIEDDTFRNAMDERMTIDDDHILPEVEIPLRYRPSIGEYTLLAFQAEGQTVSALESKSGEGAQGQGSSKTQGPPMLVGSQEELDVKAGNLMAKANSPTPEIPLPMNRNFNIFDPARDFNRWWNLDIGAEYDPRGDGFVGRALAVAVEREWRKAQVGQEWVAYPTVTFQPETRGGAGAARSLRGRKGNFDELIGVNSDGYLYTVDDWWATYQVWSRVSLSVDGDPLQFVQDPFDKTQGVLVTTTKIYTVADLFTSPSATLRFTFRDTSYSRSLDVSRITAYRLAVATNYDDGMYLTHSENLTSWSAEAQIGSGAFSGGLGTTVVASNDFQTATDLSFSLGSHNTSGGRNAPPNGQIESELNLSTQRMFFTWDVYGANNVGSIDEIRFWFRAASGTPTIQFRVYLLSQADSILYDSGATNVGATTSWQEQVFSPSTTHAVGKVRITALVTPNDAGATFYVDDLSIVSTSGLNAFFIHTLNSDPGFDTSCGSNTSWSATGGATGGCMLELSTPAELCFEVGTSAFLSRVQFQKYYPSAGVDVTEEIIYEDESHVEIDRVTRNTTTHVGYQLTQFDNIVLGVRYIKIKLTCSSGVNEARVDDLALYSGNLTLSALLLPPGMFCSSRSTGRLYTSAPISSGSDSDGFESSDNGATIGQITDPDIDPDENLCGDIAVPFSGNNSTETLCVHGRLTSDEHKLIRVNQDNSIADISPSSGGSTHGPYKTGAIKIHDSNANVIVALLTDAVSMNGSVPEAALVGLFVSGDGGATWYEAIAPTSDSTRYERVLIEGDDNLILFGAGGAIAFSENLSLNIDSKRGNLLADFPSIAEFVGVAYR